MDNPIVTGTGARGKQTKVVEFVSADAVESIRREGVAALDLKSLIEEFLHQMETVRAVYSDPALRRFLDLPDEVFDAEADILRRAAYAQSGIFCDALRRWTELVTKRNKYAQVTSKAFVKGGGAA